MQDFEIIFNRLLALKTRDMVLVVEIMTWGGGIINMIGTMEHPDN